MDKGKFILIETDLIQNRARLKGSPHWFSRGDQVENEQLQAILNSLPQVASVTPDNK